MLADFERPNIVVCVLCKGSVSVRKGDKTRFFNHISIDHEVHFDLELFYAISFMSDNEKTQFLEVLYKNKKLRKGGNNSVEKEEKIEQQHPESETLIEINSFENASHDRRESGNEGSEEALESSKEKQIQSPDKYSSIPKPTPSSTEKPIEIKKESAPAKRVKCRKCAKMILSKSIRIHMRAKHKMETSCKLCNKTILKGTLRKHIWKIHTDYKDCEYCEQMVLSSYMESHLKEVHSIKFFSEVKNNSPSDVVPLNIKQEKTDTTDPTLEETVDPIVTTKSNNYRRYENKKQRYDMSTILMINSNDFSNMEEFDLALEAKIEKGNLGEYMCKICQYRKKQRHHVKEHLESHFEVSFTCQQCNQVYKTRASLRSHKRSHQ